MPDAETTRELITLLRVRRNLTIGLVVGVLIALGAYAYRVFELAGPTSATRGSPALFFLLAVVLAVSVAAIVTTALTIRRAVGLARRVDDPAK